MSPLEQKLKALLDRRRAKATLRSLTINESHVDFSSNDFLSLAANADLKAAYLQELSSVNRPMGSGGSRLLDGNSSYAEDLEKEIADFHHAETGLLFNSGFDANAGFFACVPQEGDVVVYDELIHASVHDGMRLSRAEKLVPFRHNCVTDLETVLERLKDSASVGQRMRTRKSHVFVAVEAVYSMDGDLAPLDAIVKVVEDCLPQGTGYVVVDEAHATGVVGEQGRGLVCALGLEKRVFARLHTFGKALACNGAIILGSALLRHYLINYARPLIYTTFMSYPALAAIRASYTFLRTGKTVPLAANLQFLSQVLFRRLESTDHAAFRTLLRIPRAQPRSAIFSIELAEPKKLALHLQGKGMMVRAVVPPTVPEGTSRIRVCLHAANTVEEIVALVAAMEEWCVERVETLAKEQTQLIKQGIQIQARL